MFDRFRCSVFSVRRSVFGARCSNPGTSNDMFNTGPSGNSWRCQHILAPYTPFYSPVIGDILILSLLLELRRYNNNFDDGRYTNRRFEMPSCHKTCEWYGLVYGMVHPYLVRMWVCVGKRWCRCVSFCVDSWTATPTPPCIFTPVVCCRSVNCLLFNNIPFLCLAL